MKLWTVQSYHSVKELGKEPRFLAAWEKVTPQWRDAYQIMVDAMERRGISTHGRPPIWCWPWDTANRTEVIRALCSEAQIAEGITVVELKAPDAMAFLSSYMTWNVILDRVSDGLEVSMELMESLLRTDLVGEGDWVQVCLPFVERDWVQDVRELGRKDFEE